ncbi:MAG: glycosyltransferase family 2 protein [Methanobrevibacter sp.]|jgi:glycosyltransferase involved in cell wall biosynthesis|nr:glycosyltransferase family 2 protein [Methanobrevibacter sp.]
MFIFSIIIPVYNTKIEYFKRCLKSIKCNYLNINEFEVIIIDDGNDDFNPYQKLINKYLKSIHTIVINNNLNLKQGYCRYLGLCESQGHYVHFVDSDDEIHPQIYTILKDYLNNDPDFVLFMEKMISNKIVQLDQEEILKSLINTTNLNLKNKMFSQKDLKKLRGHLTVVLHSKVFNRKWLLNTKSWTPNLYFEDALLSTEILIKTKKFKMSYNKLYYYHFNSLSTLNSPPTMKFITDSIIVFTNALKMLYNANKWELRYCIIDNILEVYGFNIDVLKDYYPLIMKIFDGYNVNFKFFNEKQYSWFKSNEKLFKLFYPLISEHTCDIVKKNEL